MGDTPDSMRPLGSYVAKRCPRRVQLDIVQPVEQIPAADDVMMRMEAGLEFEELVTGFLRENAGSDWVFITEGAFSDEIDATLQAVESRAPVIVNSRLPSDFEQFRSGAPDLMVWDDGGYLPIDVKHHKTVDEGEGLMASSLDAPFLSDAVPEPRGLRASKDDALQLAHYRRMLEELGVASSRPWGGIIGKEGVVAWYDLTAKMWTTPAKSDGKKRKRRTSMEVYDFEFGIRREWAKEAHRSLDDPAVDLLAAVRIGECGSCGWDAYCSEDLEVGSGDASLLPGIGYRPWRRLRDEGIESRADVAGLDYRTALLAKQGVDLGKWLGLARGVPSATPVADLYPRSKKQIALLENAGALTAGEVLELIHPETAELDGAGFLPEAILNAKAATGPEPIYLRPGVSNPIIPRADIELDIDMENTEDGVYLWGVWVEDRAHTGLIESGFIPFHTWQPLDDDDEMDVFREFWGWLNDLTHRAGDAGATLLSYCWHESAENTQLRRIAGRDPELLVEVEDFIASGAWVDLEKEFKADWITGGSTSLKAIAPLAGFAWDVDDPGGGMSMVKYLEAVAGSGDAQDWLLTYNQGDVEATRQIREWLDDTSFLALPG